LIRAEAYVCTVNEINREEYLIGLFEDIGLEPRISGHMVWFSPGDSNELLRWMGKPPPGFEYKWKNKRRNVYKRKKKEAYERDYDDPQRTIGSYI